MEGRVLFCFIYFLYHFSCKVKWHSFFILIHSPPKTQPFLKQNMFPNLVSDNNGIYSISVKDKKLPNSKVAKLSQVAPLSSILGFDLDSSDFIPETTPSSSSASSLVMNRADDTNHDNEHKSISAIYKPVVYTCRILGVCPIHIVESCEGISYNFVLFSLNTLLSGIISGLVISFYVWWLRAQGRPLHWHYLEVANNHEANNETVEWIVAGKTDPVGQCHSSLMPILYKVLPLQMPFITCANIIIAFTSAPKLSQILCEFKQFEKRFQEKLQTTKFPFSTNLASARCKIALFYLIFGGMYCILVIFVTRPKCTKMYCPAWRKVAGALVVFPYITYTFMEDFKYLLLFRTLEEGFLQMALKIQEFNNESNIDKEVEAKLIGLPKLVSNWHDLLLDLRHQTRLVSYCASPHHVVSLSTTFFSLLIGVYFSVLFQFTAAVDKDKSGIAYAALGFCFVAFCRCLVKTNGCERILNAEKEVVNQLNAVKTGEDFKTQIKINALVELIGREPAQITIFNCFKLNTSFLFKIIGQIATYLVVLLQFDKM